MCSDEFRPRLGMRLDLFMVAVPPATRLVHAGPKTFWRPSGLLAGGGFTLPGLRSLLLLRTAPPLAVDETSGPNGTSAMEAWRGRRTDFKDRRWGYTLASCPLSQKDAARHRLLPMSNGSRCQAVGMTSEADGRLSYNRETEESPGLVLLCPGSPSGPPYRLTPCAFPRGDEMTNMDAVQLHTRRSGGVPQPPSALPSHARQRELTGEGATSNLGPGATERR